MRSKQRGHYDYSFLAWIGWVIFIVLATVGVGALYYAYKLFLALIGK
jgi:hypothetical protein